MDFRATKANHQNLSPFAINSNKVSDLSSDLRSTNGVLLTDSSLDLCFLNEGPKQIIAYSYHSRSYLHHQQSFAGRKNYSHLDTSSLAYCFKID
ncbi:hypothetical protein L1987_52859 [Smallanthus sonchifolius]|uniref:Uncharacterized protein n=1 Tax=Smallanthus sonchifolius TaxID=185202 RepID=A0ACB9ETS0_9ASTR|nr:hypothetical protein L1987_52859 [Smallanthus sonchifolius]